MPREAVASSSHFAPSRISLVHGERKMRKDKRLRLPEVNRVCGVSNNLG
jgi:hypothetical protein